MRKNGIKNKDLIMKRWIILIFSLIVSIVVSGQDFQNSVITSDEAGNSYDFRILYKNVNIHVKENVCYYWYRNGLLRFNVGNYTANLLHGRFEKFDFKGNLREKGILSMGPKMDYGHTGMPKGVYRKKRSGRLDF